MKYIKYLKNILSLKIEIILGLAISYFLDKTHNINYRLYKNLENNIIYIVFSIIIYQN